MGYYAKDDEVKQRLKDEGIQTKVEAYELGGEDGFDEGYDGGRRDERDEIIEDGLVIRWTDGEWRPLPGHWERTPHRWAEALNEQED